MTRFRRSVFALFALFSLLTAACGSDSTETSEAPTVVVSTNILGDVVENLVGDQVEVITIMPVGADPHDFQASAQQVAAIGDAAAMIVNGGSFEEGLLDVIETAESDGVAVYEAITGVPTIEFGEGGHDEHEDDQHEDEGHEGDDPHFFTDPARMAVAAHGIADFLIANLDGIDADAMRSSADAYIGELTSLDAAVEQTLSGLSDEQRVLITNHEVFGYFADTYEFEVVGTVVPSGSTADGASAQALAELAELIEDEGVPAIFADTSSSDELVETLASEVGEIEVVELFTESLGDDGSGGATYIEMVQTNADRIAAALAA